MVDEELEKCIKTWEHIVGNEKIGKGIETLIIATLTKLYALRIWKAGQNDS